MCTLSVKKVDRNFSHSLKNINRKQRICKFPLFGTPERHITTLFSLRRVGKVKDIDKITAPRAEVAKGGLEAVLGGLSSTSNIGAAGVNTAKEFTDAFGKVSVLWKISLEVLFFCSLLRYRYVRRLMSHDSGGGW